MFDSIPSKMAWEEPRKTGMVYRRLGNSGLHVSALALGGWLTYGGHVGDGTHPSQLPGWARPWRANRCCREDV